jgi:hypothetical protein
MWSEGIQFSISSLRPVLCFEKVLIMPFSSFQIFEKPTEMYVGQVDEYVFLSVRLATNEDVSS